MLGAPENMTRLLQDWRDGDPQALDRLMPMVVDELRRIAGAYFAREAPGHTLQPTAVVNEVYLRLVDAGRIDWQSRAQFFRIAAKVMRRVLLESYPALVQSQRECGCHTKDALRRLVELYDRWGREDEAQGYRLQLERCAAL